MPHWSWTSAVIGAATATAATTAIFVRPREPAFQLTSISLTSFHLNLPYLDVELDLTIHVTNPNLVPIHYSPATISIFYSGSLLGSASVHAGSQPPNSCQLLHLPACLNGLHLARHVIDLLADIAQGEMILDARVDIKGSAQMLWWRSNFTVHVQSHVVVDPLFLRVLEQDNKSETQIYLS